MRKEGVDDEKTVEITSQQKEVSRGTNVKAQSEVLIQVEIEGS